MQELLLRLRLLLRTLLLLCLSGLLLGALPEAQFLVAVGLQARLVLFALQAQRGGGHPAKPAGDQAADEQKASQPTPFAAQPVSHEAFPEAASSDTGSRSGLAMYP